MPSLDFGRRRKGTMLQQGLGTLLMLVVSLAGLARSQKPSLSFCSPQNNAGLYQPKSDDFMSTGLCADTCRGSFAIAIVQGNQCWCSNFAPADQVDTSECNTPCPGTADEWCGNPSQGLYGYFQLDLGVVLGTSAGTGSPSSSRTSSDSVSTTQGPSSSPPLSSSRPPSTSRVTVNPSQSSQRTSTSSRYSTSVFSDSSSKQTSSESSRTTAAPSVITSFITTGAGPPSTVLIIPSPSPSEDALGQAATAGSKGGVSGGAIAGIVIGVVGGLAAVIGAIIWFFCRRRRNANVSSNSSFVADRVGGGSSTGQHSNSVPSRQVSQMSQAGLLGSKAPRINTAGLAGGLGYDTRSNDPTSAGADRRSLGTDQRLNPWAIYKQDDRADSVSLHDERDYSRQLRVANPDE